MTVKAIETRAFGCRFRSRLEARWAVLLNALEINWQYEPEGYNTPHGMYLPDFYLPDLNTFLEIKPKEHSGKEQLKLKAVIDKQIAFGAFGYSLEQQEIRSRSLWPETAGEKLYPWPNSLDVPEGGFGQLIEEKYLSKCPVCDESLAAGAGVKLGTPSMVSYEEAGTILKRVEIPAWAPKCTHRWLFVTEEAPLTARSYIYVHLYENYAPFDLVIFQNNFEECRQIARSARFEHGEKHV